jgi:hypothetical protein
VNRDLLTAATTARQRAHELQLRAARALQAASASMAMTQRTVDAQPPIDKDRLVREVRGLRIALESRAVIEQAKGIIMGATNCDAKQAFDVLVRQSQHENRKLHDVAHELVARKSVATADGLSRGGSPR